MYRRRFSGVYHEGNSNVRREKAFSCVPCFIAVSQQSRVLPRAGHLCTGFHLAVLGEGDSCLLFRESLSYSCARIGSFYFVFVALVLLLSVPPYSHFSVIFCYLDSLHRFAESMSLTDCNSL